MLIHKFQLMDKITMGHKCLIMLKTPMDRIIMMLKQLIQLITKLKPTLITLINRLIPPTLITTTINKIIP